MISGLQYHSEFLTAEEEQDLIKIIDDQMWLSDLKRRVQHYGYKYDYRHRIIDQSMNLGPLPEFFHSVLEKLQTIWQFRPDQIIVNEYMPGQGIGTHIDCVPCFGTTIMSLSLLSPCIMEFGLGKQVVEKWLEPRSLLILEGAARYDWTHRIPARAIDCLDNKFFDRNRRLSLTFRTVKLQENKSLC